MRDAVCSWSCIRPIGTWNPFSEDWALSPRDYAGPLAMLWVGIIVWALLWCCAAKCCRSIFRTLCCDQVSRLLAAQLPPDSHRFAPRGG